MRVLRQARHQLVNFSFGRHAAGWVSGTVDDDQAGRRGNLRQHGIGVEGKALVFAQLNGDGGRATVLDDRFVNRETGVGVHDLCARLTKHQHCKKHGGFTAGHDDNAIGINAGPVAAFQVGGDGLAQCGDAVRRRITMVTIAQCLNTRLDDVRRGLEIRLPNP